MRNQLARSAARRLHVSSRTAATAKTAAAVSAGRTTAAGSTTRTAARSASASRTATRPGTCAAATASTARTSRVHVAHKTTAAAADFAVRCNLRSIRTAIGVEASSLRYVQTLISGGAEDVLDRGWDDNIVDAEGDDGT
mmetsp:Transcript_14881/g.32379  ORF Transcript_14881/g.32379 Transcript_14881/m.32379 type:complete len:139 (-) Transcript_14881:4-420(-)